MDGDEEEVAGEASDILNRKIKSLIECSKGK